MISKDRVLIVDDLPSNIRVLNDALNQDYQISVSTSGAEALVLAKAFPQPDIILLDIMMPEMDGYEVCRRLKRSPATQDIPVLFVTAMDEVADEALGLSLGAVDYITKPIKPAIVKARLRNHMSLHKYQRQLEDIVNQRTAQLKNGYIDTIHRLTLASEYKDEDTGDHIKRISYYTQEIAFGLGMNSEFCEAIFYASPMHDIGKVAIPDSILLKPGPLDPDEWEIMKTHAQIGGEILKGSDSPYLKMAMEIAVSHHERWDGSGYPIGLKAEQIPQTARIMAMVDQYDALRSKRPYKPAFDHEKACRVIIHGDGRTMPVHFDPAVLNAFKRFERKFEEIFENYKN